MDRPLAERLEYLSSLRTQLSQLHGAMAAQRPNPSRLEAHEIQRGAREIRQDLAGLRASSDARSRALRTLQTNQDAVDRLADAVVDAARSVSASIERSNQEALELSRASREQGERLLRLRERHGLPAPVELLPSTSIERAEQVDAARARMRRRGVGTLDANLYSASTQGGRTPMFERLQTLQDRGVFIASQNPMPPVPVPAGLPESLMATLRARTLGAAVRSDPCSICLEVMCRGDSVLQLGCDHLFHASCLLKWLGRSASCPLCKEPVVLPLRRSQLLAEYAASSSSAPPATPPSAVGSLTGLPRSSPRGNGGRSINAGSRPLTGSSAAAAPSGGGSRFAHGGAGLPPRRRAPPAGTAGRFG